MSCTYYHVPRSIGWILDSSDSNHMPYSLNYLQAFRPSWTTKILIANSGYLDVIAKGDLYMENERFNDVLFMPDITHNLLLVYQIAKWHVYRVYS